MKILLLTPQLPYPPHQGTTIRNFNLIRGLADRHEVDLLTFLQPGDDPAAATPLRQLCRHIEGIPVPGRTMRQRLVWTLTSPLPDMALRLPSPTFRAALADRLRQTEYDVVQVEGIEMAQYGVVVSGQRSAASGRSRVGARRQGPGISGQRPSGAPASPQPPAPSPLFVFDDHNAEYVLQQRAFETDARLPRRWIAALYSLIQWQKLRRYEAQVCRLADAAVAVSDADAAALRRLVPGLSIAVIPNGVDVAYYGGDASFQPPISSPYLAFTGKMDFRPNVDAVTWFCTHVLPRLWEGTPDLRFAIVGRDPSPRVRALAADNRVVVTGYVDDIRPYIAGAAVYVVPLRVGGGTRLKVLEAMAMAQPIVSTQLGCEGIDAEDGRELIVGDSAEDFADAVLTLLRDPARATALGAAARRFVAERYDWRVIVPRFEAVYRRQPG